MLLFIGLAALLGSGLSRLGQNPIERFLGRSPAAQPTLTVLARKSSLAIEPRAAAPTPASSTESGAATRPRVTGSGRRIEEAVAVVRAKPPLAGRVPFDGVVTVEIRVDRSDLVTEAHAISGSRLLRASAEAAAKRGVYRPATVIGPPVESAGTIRSTSGWPPDATARPDGTRTARLGGATG